MQKSLDYKKLGISISGEIYLYQAHVQLSLLTISFLDAARENTASEKIGTTGKGIGPAYEDKVSRKGIKFVHLFDKELLRSRLELALVEKESLFKDLYKIDYPSLEEELERLYTLGQKLKQYAADTFSIIDKAMAEGKNVVYEGAQGVLFRCRLWYLSICNFIKYFCCRCVFRCNNCRS